MKEASSTLNDNAEQNSEAKPLEGKRDPSGVLITVLFALVGFGMVLTFLYTSQRKTQLWNYKLTDKNEQVTHKVYVNHYGYEDTTVLVPKCGKGVVVNGATYCCLPKYKKVTRGDTIIEVFDKFDCSLKTDECCTNAAVKDSSYKLMRSPFSNQKLSRVAFAQNQNLPFNQFPQFLLWVVALACLGAFSFGVIPLLLVRIKKQFTYGNNKKPSDLEVKKAPQHEVPNNTAPVLNKPGYMALALFLMILALAAALFLGNGLDMMTTGFDWMDQLKLLFYSCSVKWVVGLNFIGPAFAIFGLFAVGFKAYRFWQKVQKGDVDDNNQRVDVSKEVVKAGFERLRADLSQFLQVLGVLVSASVITTALFRKALLSAVITPPEIQLFPFEFVTAYAFLFTAILFICYAPVYGYLRNMGQALFVKYPTLKETLVLGNTAFTNLKAALAVLGPTVVGLITNLLEGSLS